MPIFKRIFSSKVETVSCRYVCDCGKQIYSSERDATIRCPACGKPMQASECIIGETEDQDPKNS